MSEIQTGLARCYRHPMRETGVRCVRCDRPICPDCMRPAAVGFMCPDDVRLGAASVRTPRTQVGARATTSGVPVVTYTLIAINIAVFLATFVSTQAGILHQQTGGLMTQTLLVPARVTQDHQYYRLITSAFLHWNLLHLAANMFALFVIGPALENLLGRWRFVALYLLAALGGSIAVILFANPFTFVAGASGAIFGLFGAAAVLYRQLGISLAWLGATLVVNIAFTFTVPNISIQGHAGGLIAGAIAAACIGGLPTRERRRPSTTWQGGGLIGLFVLECLLVVVAAFVSA